MRRLVTVTIAGALLVAGCGQSGAPAQPSAEASAEASPSIAAADPAAALQAVLDEGRAIYGAPGGLALHRVGNEAWFAASGAADLEGTAIGPQTRFRVASITKPIVATLVVDAVERGELTLDDDVGGLLPGTLRDEPPVTVRQLLDHTSGIFDESNEGDPTADIAALPDELRTEAEALHARYLAGDRVIASAELLVALSETHDRYFPPGTSYHYSNTNYQLAAMVLEEVTGRSLAELLEDRIAAPLGLHRTTVAPPDLGSPELRGYQADDDGGLVDITDELMAFGNGGNGGIISTAGELLTMLQAIAAGEFASGDLLNEQIAPNRADYGLGIVTYSLSCGTFIGHGGSVNGTVSIALVSPDGTAGVVLAFNLRSDDDPMLEALGDRILCGTGQDSPER